MRQTAVYQQYNAENHIFCWIVVQIPRDFEPRLQQYLEYGTPTSSPYNEPKPIVLYTMLYLWTGLHWRAYLNDLENRLARLVYK